MEQILISNFKAIVNANAVPIQIRPMTVLMGEQASGKSTVAKLIYFISEVLTIWRTSKNGTRITQIAMQTRIFTDLIRVNPRWNRTANRIRFIRVLTSATNSL